MTQTKYAATFSVRLYIYGDEHTRAFSSQIPADMAMCEKVIVDTLRHDGDLEISVTDENDDVVLTITDEDVEYFVYNDECFDICIDRMAWDEWIDAQMIG